jgi:hypothetical protein
MSDGFVWPYCKAVNLLALFFVFQFLKLLLRLRSLKYFEGWKEVGYGGCRTDRVWAGLDSLNGEVFLIPTIPMRTRTPAAFPVLVVL